MRRFAVAALAAALAAAGCAFLSGTKKISNKKPEPPTFSQYHLDGWEWDRVDRVLVLPVLNESQYTRAGDEVRAAFTSELQRLGRFEVVAAPDDKALLALQIHRGGRFDEAAMLDLARHTSADVIVHIIITHYSPFPRPRIGLVVQAVGPQEAKVVASVDGLWDTTDAAVAERCRRFYRQRPHTRPPFIARNYVVESDDGLAADLALDSPALFQRWVSQEVALALLGRPIPGVISSGTKSQLAATAGAASCVQPVSGAAVPDAAAGKVK
ncbi:hypothetical protein [Frigoriglobus tundricola]|uniref:Lipoprotein n=1 Tax=Frigoriglobus tundricola TaxID=2774151 RepID=A0A6M5YN59_9BACT|nr:hypothetical protein [Frigoriglobus tundricola]QJW94392.1 hypothetical protein FTUN_1912 [Frigoriglobus tundricola]